MAPTRRRRPSSWKRAPRSTDAQARGRTARAIQPNCDERRALTSTSRPPCRSRASTRAARSRLAVLKRIPSARFIQVDMSMATAVSSKVAPQEGACRSVHVLRRRGPELEDNVLFFLARCKLAAFEFVLADRASLPRPRVPLDTAGAAHCSFAVPENVSTTSYIPGSNFAIASAC